MAQGPYLRRLGFGRGGNRQDARETEKWAGISATHSSCRRSRGSFIGMSSEEAKQGGEAPGAVHRILDVRSVDDNEVSELFSLWRGCTFIQAASQRLTTVTLDGDLELMLGDLFPMPEFGWEQSARVLDNFRRAMMWIDVVGVVPFSVEVPVIADVKGGQPVADVMRVMDEAAGSFGKAGAPSDHPELGGDGGDNGGGGDGDEANENAPEKRMLEQGDFEFFVPSPGTGTLRTYVDARDQVRKTTFEPKHPATVAADGRKRQWYAYTVQSPSENGEIDSIVARLRPQRDALTRAERLEERGAELGIKPVVVTQPQPPGKNQRQLDRHRAFMTDSANVMESGQQDSQGLPPIFSQALQRTHSIYGSILSANGIDPKAAFRAGSASSGSGSPVSDLDEHRVAEDYTYAAALTPHRFMNTEAKRNDYIAQVAAEYGVSQADFSAGSARFKIDPSTSNARFVEHCRRRRRILSNLFYSVLSIRNAGRARGKLQQSYEVLGNEIGSLQETVNTMTRLVDEGVRESIQRVPQPHHVDQTVESLEPPRKRAKVDDAEPASSSPLELPASVQKLIVYREQLLGSFQHLGEARRLIVGLLESSHPFKLRWTQPLTADERDLKRAVDSLSMAEVKRAEIWRHHYGMS